MVVIKKIGVMSLAKLQGLVMAIIGLILGILFAIFGTIIGFSSGAVPMGIFGSVGAIGIIVFPIMYGILGFIGGAIAALLYNLVAKWVGGVDLEFEK